VIGFRPPKINFDRGVLCWKRIRRDNRAVQALSLPKISNYNMRSLLPKIGNFSLDVKERELDISFLTEVWGEIGKQKAFYATITNLESLIGSNHISANISALSI
jgi:hypothetical protein